MKPDDQDSIRELWYFRYGETTRRGGNNTAGAPAVFVSRRCPSAQPPF